MPPHDGQVEYDATGASGTPPRVLVDNVTAFATVHDDFRTERVSAAADVAFLQQAFARMAVGARAAYDAAGGAFRISPE
jgi:hypothetical protein